MGSPHICENPKLSRSEVCSSDRSAAIHGPRPRQGGVFSPLRRPVRQSLPLPGRWRPAKAALPNASPIVGEPHPRPPSTGGCRAKRGGGLHRFAAAATDRQNCNSANPQSGLRPASPQAAPVQGEVARRSRDGGVVCRQPDRRIAASLRSSQ